MSFRERHVEMQYLVRELTLLRQHNQSTVLDMELFLFAEGALVLLALERFVRIVLGERASPTDTLYNLLQQARSQGLLTIPGDDAEGFIRDVKDVRNTLAHANYEQAAKVAGCADVREYFKTVYTPLIESLAEVLNMFMEQIDPETGRPYGQV